MPASAGFLCIASAHLHMVKMANQLSSNFFALPPFSGNHLSNHTYPNFYDSIGYRIILKVVDIKFTAYLESNSM